MGLFDRFLKGEDEEPLEHDEEAQRPRVEQNKTRLPQVGDSAASVPRRSQRRSPGVRARSVTSGASSALPATASRRFEKYARAAKVAPVTTMRPVGGNVAIALDATSSMSPLIDGARRDLSEIVRRVQEAGSQVSIQLIAYRDYCDGNRLLEHSDLSSNPEGLVQWLQGIRAIGGGDTPEAVEQALEQVIKLGGFNVVLIAGDAPSKTRKWLDEEGKREQRTARDLASELGQHNVPIHTFVVGNDPSAVADFEAIAKCSGGQTGFLDGSTAMLDMAVMAILDRLRGPAAVERYTKQYQLTDASKRFAARLLTYQGK